MDKINKSHFTQKNTEKEVQSPEEIKLRKLEDIVQKLQQAVEKGNNLESSHQEQSKRNTTNKSNFSSPTSTRMKEDRSDREFLSNFMNIDEKNVIPPIKMHLLTDNDTNQNITAGEKFQKLSNLLLDDKNITEFNFIRNSEDRVKLHLYSAFSKKSKDIFMNEKHQKQSKNQILFHKINDIHIPKFGFSPPDIGNENNNDNNNNDKDSISSGKNEEEKNQENKELNDQNKDNNCENIKEIEDKKFQDNYFRQENKGYFHIPSLIKISNKKSVKKEIKRGKTFIPSNTIFNSLKSEAEKKKEREREKEREKEKEEKEKEKEEENKFWDPEIDSDTLSYINHNFICIEDIYNKKNIEEKYDKNNSKKNEEEDVEHNLTPIIAKEIITEFDDDVINVLDKDGKTKDKKTSDENKGINKFIEFIAINKGVAKQEYQVVSNIKSQEIFNAKLKNEFDGLINKYIKIDKNEFPKGSSLTPIRIERFLRNKFLGEVCKQTELSIGGKSTEQSENNNLNKKEKEKEKDKDKEKEKKTEDKNINFIGNESEQENNSSFNLNLENN